MRKNFGRRVRRVHFDKAVKSLFTGIFMKCLNERLSWPKRCGSVEPRRNSSTKILILSKDAHTRVDNQKNFNISELFLCGVLLLSFSYAVDSTTNPEVKREENGEFVFNSVWGWQYRSLVDGEAKRRNFRIHQSRFIHPSHRRLRM